MASEVEIERMLVRLVGDSTSFQKMLRDAETASRRVAGEVEKAGRRIEVMTQRLRSFGKAIGSVGKSLMGIGGRLSLFVTGPIIAAGVGMIKAASDAAEGQSKFEQVFRDVRKEANLMAKDLDENFGLAGSQAKRLLTDTADLLTGFGFTQQQALELSGEVQKLAVDLASFTNIQGGAERASSALTRGLLGERESMKLLGIAINQNTPEWKDMVKQIKATMDVTDTQAKAFATLRLAQIQSKNALGDYARTSHLVANATRDLGNNISEIAVQFGRELLPIVSKAIAVVGKIVDRVRQFTSEQRRLILIVAGVTAVVGPLLLAFGGLTVAIGAVVSGIAAFVGFISTVGAPVLIAIAAITALSVALGVLVARMISFDDVKKFFINAIGFVQNFTENMKIMFDFIRKNWFNVIKDMLGAWITFNKNMIFNAGIGIETMIRLYTVWASFMTNKFITLWEVDFVGAVVNGITRAVEKLEQFAGFIGQVIIDAFQGKIVSKDSISSFLEGLEADVGKGVEAKGIKSYFSALGDVIKEQSKKLKGPLDGFKSTITEFPKFNLKTDFGGLFDTSVSSDVVTGAVEAGKTIGTAFSTGLKEEIAATIPEITSVMRSVSPFGIEASEAGSAESAGKLAAFRDRSVDDIRALRQKESEGKKETTADKELPTISATLLEMKEIMKDPSTAAFLGAGLTGF